jgi:hypothetical protein
MDLVTHSCILSVKAQVVYYKNIIVVYNCMYSLPRIYIYLKYHSCCLYCNAYYGGEERLRNVTHLFVKFLMVKVGPLNVVSHNVGFYKNVTTTLNDDLLCIPCVIKIFCDLLTRCAIRLLLMSHCCGRRCCLSQEATMQQLTCRCAIRLLLCSHCCGRRCCLSQEATMQQLTCRCAIRLFALLW